MTIVTSSVLIESKSARSNQLAQIDEERATEVLNKIKSLYFALWEGSNTTVTDQVAEFYEVPEGSLRKLLKFHRSEFESDGLKTIRGKALSDARYLWSLPSKTSQVTVWTPRAVLRAGMLMRDSEVAKAVRTSLLNAVEKVIPAQAEELERLRLENQNLHLQLEVAKAQKETAYAQERLLSASQILAMVNPTLPALVLGKSDAVLTKTEVIEKTVLVNERGKAISTYKGISKTKLAQRYGMKRAKEVVNWLRSIGKENVLKPGVTPTFCQYIPYSEIAELDRLWASRKGTRQFLIGE